MSKESISVLSQSIDSLETTSKNTQHEGKYFSCLKFRKLFFR